MVFCYSSTNGPKQKGRGKMEKKIRKKGSVRDRHYPNIC